MPCETATAIVSMMMGGVLERFPRLKVCFAHGGGAFPFVIGRVEHGFNVRPDLCAAENPFNPRSGVKVVRVWCLCLWVHVECDAVVARGAVWVWPICTHSVCRVTAYCDVQHYFVYWSSLLQLSCIHYTSQTQSSPKRHFCHSHNYDRLSSSLPPPGSTSVRFTPTLLYTTKMPSSTSCPPWERSGVNYIHGSITFTAPLPLLLQDRVLLGSDYPFPLGEHHPGKLVQSLSDWPASLKVGGAPLTFDLL